MCIIIRQQNGPKKRSDSISEERGTVEDVGVITEQSNVLWQIVKRVTSDVWRKKRPMTFLLLDQYLAQSSTSTQLPARWRRPSAIIKDELVGLKIVSQICQFVEDTFLKQCNGKTGEDHDFNAGEFSTTCRRLLLMKRRVSILVSYF